MIAFKKKARIRAARVVRAVARKKGHKITLPESIRIVKALERAEYEKVPDYFAEVRLGEFGYYHELDPEVRRAIDKIRY